LYFGVGVLEETADLVCEVCVLGEGLLLEELLVLLQKVKKPIRSLTPPFPLCDLALSDELFHLFNHFKVTEVPTHTALLFDHILL